MYYEYGFIIFRNALLSLFVIWFYVKSKRFRRKPGDIMVMISISEFYFINVHIVDIFLLPKY